MNPYFPPRSPQSPQSPQYPLPIARALHAASQSGNSGAALRPTEALTYYLGAVAVAHYTRAILTGEISPDPTLSRSLRTLRRVLPGQWLLWAARGFAAAPNGAIEGLAEWYERPQSGALSEAYASILHAMRGDLAYTGEYGERADVSPRNFLELTDQLQIRVGKVGNDALSPETQLSLAEASLLAVKEALEAAPALTELVLYAPVDRKVLMGLAPTTPMPPLNAPPDAAEVATLLLYPPGEPPDYTKRPTLGQERQPLFPLDPLLSYLYCATCGTNRVSALREVVDSIPKYIGLDPECGHTILPHQAAL